MKLGTSKLLAYFASFAYTLSCNAALVNGYPTVYTMDVPILSNKSMAEFIAELDLMDTEIGPDVGEDGIITLKFIVHSEDELDYLSERTPYDMVKDSQETSSLHSFASTPISLNQSADTISGFPCYRNIQGMFALMASLERKASSIKNLNVKVTDIGDTYEKTVNQNNGYDMLALKITGNGVAVKGWSTEKGIVFITCGIHAREYSPPELCARWAESLVNGYGTDTEITSVLDHTEVHLVLESNPDGRAIAETNRAVYQRKNTRPGCSSFRSRGVDLNRNFPFKWGGSGSSKNKCTQNYRGTSPGSEPEVKAIMGYAESVFPESQRKRKPLRDMNKPYPEDSTVGLYIDIHSYSDLIIWPWSYKNKKSANEESHQSVARKLKSFNGYALAGPRQPDWLYPASGGTCDYFYGNLGALSLVYELGSTFYQDCQTFENKIHPDNIPGFMYVAKISSKPYHLTKGPDVINHNIPKIIDYDSNPNLQFNVTVSDSKLSSGPGNHRPSTQNIVSISLCADMHPYDVDSSGSSPKLVTIEVNGGSTVTQTISLALSTPNFLRDPLIGNHILYLQATDSEGSTGPVTAVAFEVSDGGLCGGLGKQQCGMVKYNDQKVCIYSKKMKINKGCVPRNKYDHDCAQYTSKSSCTSGEHERLCKWSSSSCSHMCNGLHVKACQQICTSPKIPNPCFGCQPKTTC